MFIVKQKNIVFQLTFNSSTEACAGAEGSARDIAPTLPSLGGKNGIERLVLLPTSVSDLSWCFGSMYKNPYKCYVKRLDIYL